MEHHTSTHTVHLNGMLFVYIRMCNITPSVRLEFSWASVELTRTEYIICESQGSVSLTIQRKGNVQDSSYVTVQVLRIALFVYLIIFYSSAEKDLYIQVYIFFFISIGERTNSICWKGFYTSFIFDSV